MRRVLLTGLLLAAMAIHGAPESRAMQQNSLPEKIAAAEVVFADGIRAFEEERYETALSRFVQVENDFPFHIRVTAARLMGAKTLYRLKRYQGVINALESFEEEFPTSRYIEEAARLVSLAQDALEFDDVGPFNIGVLLSLDRQQVAVSQAVFNGLRIATDEHNQTAGVRPVRLVFRDMGVDAGSIRNAMRDLASEGVVAVVGTLFSEDAIVAAGEAERLNLVFIAPLATDERVSENKRFAFQANPTIAIRGELMARFAVRGLRLNRLGVIAVADNQGMGERLSDAFVEEASRLGAEINLIKLLHQESEWSALPDSISGDTLRYVDAIYAPMSADNPTRFASSILSAMDRYGTRSEGIRLLGNTPWHDLPLSAQASKYTVTYTNDFLPQEDNPATETFSRAFRQVAGRSPQRPAFTGYDVMTFLIDVLESKEGKSLDRALRESPEYLGLSMRLFFEGSNVNHGLFYHRYRDGRQTLIR